MTGTPAGWSPTGIAMHSAWAFELLLEHLRRNRRPVPLWVQPVIGLCRTWAGGGASAASASTPEPRLLTYEQVGHLLGGLSLQTVERRVAAGQLRAVQEGRQRRIRPEDLELYLDALTPVHHQEGSPGGHEGSTSHGADPDVHGVVMDHQEHTDAA